MPWTCKSCSQQVSLDDISCPHCQGAKSAWTLIKDETRTFVVSARKLQIKRGGLPVHELMLAPEFEFSA